MMDSLNLDVLDLRFKEIDIPYKSTFKWIYNNIDLGFGSWLRGGRGIY